MPRIEWKDKIDVPMMKIALVLVSNDWELYTELAWKND